MTLSEEQVDAFPFSDEVKERGTRNAGVPKGDGGESAV